MTELLTPGVYRQTLDPIRSAGRLARGDIPVLLGYAARGPLDVPVRVYSLRQFEDVFGTAPTHGFLWHAVKGFFETGGQTAYVLRVASGRARAAWADLSEGPQRWRATASFPWPMIDPRRLSGAQRVEAGCWVQIFERQVLDEGERSPDPGGWGNGLSLDVRRSSRVRTVTLPEVVHEGTASRLASLAGLEAASVLELTQVGADGATHLATRVPATVDTDRQLVHWSTGLDTLGFDLQRPIRIASVEFDLSVYRDGKLDQSFDGLAPHPDHPASIIGTTARGCRSLMLESLAGDPDAVDWSDPTSWPREGRFDLSGGTDGLEDMTATPWLDALDAVGTITDAAMVAAPDLVLAETSPPPAPGAAPVVEDCADLVSRPPRYLPGVVTGVDEDGVEVPLTGVVVDAAGPGGTVATDAAGAFALSGVEDGLVTLRLSRTGFEPVEFLAQSSPFASAPPVRITMTRIATPQPLDPDAVLTVQRAMADPSRVGPYKVAIVDPPAARSRLDEISTWRARLGDDARLGFFAPWLTVPVSDPSTGDLLACPPSGHVCGAFAAAETAFGIHRAGANLPLRYVEGTTLAIEDADQATLNPVGINAIRAFPGRGIRIFGARSLASDPEWRFLTARRIVDAIERTLERALHWMVFEPNSIITRHAVATAARTLLGRLHRDGMLAGAAPEAAFAVKCDLENNPEEGRAAGRLVVDIAVAPTTPYEFVLFRLGHTYDAPHVTEVG